MGNDLHKKLAAARLGRAYCLAELQMNLRLIGLWDVGWPVGIDYYVLPPRNRGVVS